ncbi:unnamed protein product [Larinioides sclopetarius]|uniref:Uncharacterized protein n=1 Tax=Larinioides sclopetarius TaxID=280406 RepID=A0AAV1ZP95_9ARAC
MLGLCISEFTSWTKDVCSRVGVYLLKIFSLRIFASTDTTPNICSIFYIRITLKDLWMFIGAYIRKIFEIPFITIFSTFKNVYHFYINLYRMWILHPLMIFFSRCLRRMFIVLFTVQDRFEFMSVPQVQMNVQLINFRSMEMADAARKLQCGSLSDDEATLFFLKHVCLLIITLYEFIRLVFILYVLDFFLCSDVLDKL